MVIGIHQAGLRSVLYHAAGTEGLALHTGLCLPEMDRLLFSFQLLKAQMENTRCFPLSAVCLATNSEPPGLLERDLRAGLGPHLSEPTAVTLASESSGPGALLAP